MSNLLLLYMSSHWKAVPNRIGQGQMGGGLNLQRDIGVRSPRRIGCFGLITIVLLVTWIMSLSLGRDSQEMTNPDKTTGTYCAILMKYLNESKEIMANAGTTASVSDVASLLKEHGTSLLNGFDAEMAGGVERLNLIRSAGEQLLKIRTAILDGRTVTEPATRFNQDAQAIKSTCQ